MTQQDAELEELITDAVMRFQTAKSRRARAKANADLKRLVAQRRPERVREMERAKGLR